MEFSDIVMLNMKTLRFFGILPPERGLMEGLAEFSIRSIIFVGK